MKPNHPDELLARIQAAAERSGPVDTLPEKEVQAYRAVYLAIRAAPRTEPSADFASSMERLTRDHGEQAAVEVWVMRLPLALLVMCCAGSVLALGFNPLSAVAPLLERGAAVAGPIFAALAAALLVDRLCLRVSAARQA
jgi:hypothetical protein